MAQKDEFGCAIMLRVCFFVAKSDFGENFFTKFGWSLLIMFFELTAEIITVIKTRDESGFCDIERWIAQTGKGLF